MIKAIAVSILAFISISSTVFASEGFVVKTFYPGSDYEVKVYEINGTTKGNTMLIIGGIQGDEPGGYLSADLYTDIQLEKGRLVVIPRANLLSVIMYNRGPHGDMNRLFVNDFVADTPDKAAASVIMEYMKEADVLLNLHDGWGFYSDIYIDSQRNPNRFGQSIIVDEEQYTCENGNVIELGAIAKDILAKVNSKIAKKDLHLAYFNTNTSNPDGRFKSMSKTATWYALRNYCIPSFGIEASKNIKSVEDKILFHNYAINEFMEYFDIRLRYPAILLPKPILDYSTILIDESSLKVYNNQTIEIPKGASLSIIDITSNYERGLTVDIIGYGNKNDIDKKFTINFDTDIKFFKDNIHFATVHIKVIPQPYISYNITGGSYHFSFIHNGNNVVLESGSTLKVKKGDILNIVSVSLANSVLDMPINLKGWVPEGVIENVGDDRGYDIIIGDRFILSYSLGGKGKVFPIVANDKNKDISTVYIEIIK